MKNQSLEGIKVILLDIEGTTTPLDFVHKTLFRYASDNVENFLRKNFNDGKVKALVEELKLLYTKHLFDDQMPEQWKSESDKAQIKSTVSFVKYLISRDSKESSLKALQGLIWEEGYSNGALKGEVYEDVPRAMERWRNGGISICIYSSGSVLAQKLIFSTTEYGDLTKFISAFYDTAVGGKRELNSYARISLKLETRPEKVLFISDVFEEVDAARKAGMKVILISRKEPSVIPENSVVVISDFNNL